MAYVTLKFWDCKNVTQRTDAAPRDASNTLIHWLETWEPEPPGTSGSVQAYIAIDVPFTHTHIYMCVCV